MGEQDVAAELLEAAIEQAVPLGEEAPLLALRQRLTNGLPLRSSAARAERD
jgi:hypothetical protein